MRLGTGFLVMLDTVLTALDNGQVEFWMHDADSSKGILLRILANLESMTAVGKVIDSVDSDKDSLCSITFLLLCNLLLPPFFGQFPAPHSCLRAFVFVLRFRG
jgi:hypothetical protein